MTPIDRALERLAEEVEARCATCGGSGMVGTGTPNGEGGEDFDRCPDCDPYASAGLDVGGLMDGPEMMPITDATVLCSEGTHEVTPGEDCTECDHGCGKPDCDCPGRDDRP